MRTSTAVLLLLLPLFAQAQQYSFGVYLDDKRIGTHRFTVQHDEDDTVRVTSLAEFDVKVLRVPVFRYRHSALEVWRNGCLESIDTRTQVNGQRTELRGIRGSDGFTVDVRSRDGSQQQLLPECTASYAYWDAATLHRHAELLNSQTGAYQTVNRQLVDATDRSMLELIGPDFEIDLSYDSASGRWLSLHTITEDGRVLEYRPENSANESATPL
jgi:hypothetical protein